MKLVPVDNSTIDIVSNWLNCKENCQWLDFGRGQQALDRMSLKFMTQRNTHLLRVFTEETGAIPIGVVAMSDINQVFETATLWYVLGDKRFQRKGYTARAVHEVLAIAFRHLRLHAVQAWTVEANLASAKVLENNGFKRIGLQRECHRLDGQLCNRLLFDILATEFEDGLKPCSSRSS